MITFGPEANGYDDSRRNPVSPQNKGEIMNKVDLLCQIEGMISNAEIQEEDAPDIATAIVDLFRDNLKDLIEVDEEKILDIIREHSHPQSGSLFIENFKATAGDIASKNPIKIKEE